MVPAPDCRDRAKGTVKVRGNVWRSRQRAKTGLGSGHPDGKEAFTHLLICSLACIFKRTFIECCVLNTTVDDGTTEMSTCSLPSFCSQCGEQMSVISNCRATEQVVVAEICPVAHGNLRERCTYSLSGQTWVGF